MTYDTLQVETRDGIRLVRLNRPDVRNAFNSTMTFELSRCLEAANQEDAVRVVVLTGNGSAFSAGADIKEGPALWARLKNKGDIKGLPELLVQEFDKPTIAAINGAAIGFGLTLTLCCDIRVAAESARLSMRFTELGLTPEAGSPYLLPRIVGLANALDLALTAKTVDSTEAYRIGLVGYLATDRELMETAMGIASSIARKSPAAIRTARRSFYRSLETTFEEQRAVEKLDFDNVLHGVTRK